MSRFTAIIVDDEEPARVVLREMLERHDDVEIVAECPNGFEAVKAIGEHRPDVAFLDIQMPKLDGFEVLELLDEPPAVVFVTAYDEFALRAFEVSAVDYLLKPFGVERLDAAVEKLRHSRNAPPESVLAAGRRRPRERLLIRERSDVHVIPAEEIEVIEARDDHVRISSRGRTWLKQETLTSLEETLPADRFVRVHRSWLVNVGHLDRVELVAKDTREAVMRDGTRIPVSRAGYARIKELR